MRQSLDYFDDEDHWRSVQAESRGSKLLATYYQRKAWDSSGGYDGDRMGPIYHANSMRARYEKLHDQLTKFEQKLLDVIEQSPDVVEKRRPRWSLSKSSYIKGWQCPKYLYLDKYVPEGRTRHSEQTLAAFSEGRKFEQSVRLRGFQGAVDLGRLLGRNIIHYPGFTQYFLKKRASCILYEAGFSAENVLVLADIVVKHWFWLDIYEIKRAKELTDVFLRDAAIQYYVTKKSGPYRVRSINVILKDDSKHSGYRILNVTRKVRKILKQVKQEIRDCKQVLRNGSVPDIAMGEQCDTPYECQFKAFCRVTGSM